MSASRLRAASITVVSALALSACAMPYGGVGVGYGSGGYYGGYGNGGYYGGYGYDPYSSGYDGYGYGRSPAYGYPYSPYGGWYDSYYYPGSGYYVYGRDGSRHRWSEAQQRYWEAHRRDRDSKPRVFDVVSRPFEDHVRSQSTTGSTTTAQSAPTRVERRVRSEGTRPTIERQRSFGRTSREAGSEATSDSSSNKPSIRRGRRQGSSDD